MATTTTAPKHPTKRSIWPNLLLALVLALGALATRPPLPTLAANVTVTNTNDSGGGSLRQAIQAAETTAGADTILFSLPGSAPWTITLGSSLPTITKPLTIIGPGRDKLTIQGNNTFRLITVDAPGQAIEISGLTLTKGKAVGSYGGNLRSIGGDLTLTDVALTNGTADDNMGGAGAYLSNGLIKLSSVLVKGNVAKGTGSYGSGAGLNISEFQGTVIATIEASVISDNESTWFRGGGLMVSRSSGVAGRTVEVTLTDTTVIGNKAEPNSGAGIYNDQGTLTLNNSTVSDSSGQADGVGVYNKSGTVTLNGSTISGNVTQILHGGGLYNDEGTMNVNNSTISGNIAPHSGGGIYNRKGTLVVLGSTISGNKAGYGGGISNDQGKATLINTTVSGNTAGYGGGLENFQGEMTLAFATVVGNTASIRGGGLMALGYNGITAKTTVGQSVVIGNGSPLDADCMSDLPALAPITSAGYNVVGGGTGCPSGGAADTTVISPASVLKEVLADNGGPTKTHALVYGSEAIDRVPCINTIDQRGVSRPQGGNCDSGAVEYLPIAPVTLTLETNGGAIGRSPVGNGNGPFTYPLGTPVTLTAKPSAGKIFVGWTVDGLGKGWANPLTITMNASYTVKANYALVVLFPDVSEGRADAAAIIALASRGAIKGYANGNYGPDDGVTRAQMAALIARATPTGPGQPSVGVLTPPACLVAGTWDCESWGTPFVDGQGFDVNLWRNVGVLAYYGVVKGYTPEACAALGRQSPCFGPNDAVSYAQTISFITRAMVAKGYWRNQPNAPQPYAGVPAAHAADFATFRYYTGSILTAPPDWNAGATRGWFAQALWSALNSYWGTDGTMNDGYLGGGYVP